LFGMVLHVEDLQAVKVHFYIFILLITVCFMLMSTLMTPILLLYSSPTLL